MDSKETLYDVYWEGPFAWDKRKGQVKLYHVLYQIYGQHPVYGSNVLLYIGRTEKGMERLNQHDSWVWDECDEMTFRVASLGEFTSWKEWNESEHYDPAKPAIVEKIEAILIHAHSPAYNAANKSSAKGKSKGIRVFNSGRFGQLLPEVSYKYYFGD